MNRILKQSRTVAVLFAVTIATLSLTTSVAVVQPPSDVDQDGIPDALEHQLLARFTPLLRFTNDGGEEQYRPMDAVQYIRWSELQSVGDEGKGVLVHNADTIKDPRYILTQGTDLTSSAVFHEHDRYLNPLEDVPTKGGNWARHGFAWNDVLANKNIGLYGHVTPFVKSQQLNYLQCNHPNQPQGRDAVLCDLDIGRPESKYYKVEYWQFFGYNGDDKPFSLGDHEGDWCSVQLLIDPSNLAIVEIQHFFHGHVAGFDLRRYSKWVSLPGVNVHEYHGPNYPNQVSLTWHDGAEAQNHEADRFAQNNVVQLAADSYAGPYTHPVVYVEHGGHEFWPTAAWSYQDASAHSGNDKQHTYTAATPPNLGEVEHPLSETPYAEVIMRYNGLWGAFSRKNSPPQGPALHGSWTWPAQSSIRWLLPKDLGF